MMGQSPVLLVIDDEPGVLGIVRHHAQRAGFSVVTCTTGANAVALVREHDVGSLPVLAGESVVGVLTRDDLRRAGVPARELGSRPLLGEEPGGGD